MINRNRINSKKDRQASQRRLLTTLKRSLSSSYGLLLLLIPLVPTLAIAAEEATTKPSGFLGLLDAVFSQMVNFLAQIFFLEIFGFPFIVLWLMIGAIFFTLRMGFVNIRAFKHAIDVVTGKYDNPDDEGDVSHFQALATALSGTVGLGNIAGVAIAVQVGGPGAIFWMTLGGFFGMSSKFVECSLAQMYRRIQPDGTVAGGPMYYLSKGLGERGLRPLGNGLAILFAILCILASMGGGNMFQANQAYAALAGIIPALPNWVFGLVVAALVGFVIIGGIHRIASVTARLVPAMAVIYVLVCLWILLSNLIEIPAAFGTIITQAFAPEAVGGGFIGTLVQGVRRSAFSNEAGMGSAAIAHSAARTDEPLREGIVALLEPFIDTIVICNLTGLTIVITGVYRNTTATELNGVELTAAAFSSVISWFPIILAIAVVLFAFSTMISWSYYGEKAWGYLFGAASVIIYKAIYVACVFIGSVVNLGSVLDFSDMMLLAMAFPNLLGCYILSGKLASALSDYMNRLNSGQMPVYSRETSS
ncbi:alanine/glycine:cation symporter family protein [Limnoraphis robusta]|uniref:Alanine glycine permease n=1 Tax=Limnoraphis robusta CS-951 TaxID=1637645 RepID=A0A0F5Y9J3_9CYAN|nr:alanine/glycine:cation symporter family protein [Limnoraphis robusta]KKD35453.1 alanine glycine permease [Limnoraphis robusta CS-951]